MDKLRELLADYAHSSWSSWMKYLFSKTYPMYEQFDKENGDVVIPKECVDRWKRQMETAYKDLSEKEKDSDRKEADKMIHIMKDFIDEYKNNKKGDSNST